MIAVHITCGVFWVMSILHVNATPSYPVNSASPYPNPTYVPAMPGKTPKCAKDPRLTFCLHPAKYPKQRIVYLLENKMYDVDTFLQDETRDTYVFEARETRKPIPLSYGSPSFPGESYLPPHNTNNNSYSTHRRRSKFGTPHHLKPPPSVAPHSTHFYFPSNTTPSLNSFSSSYPNKYDEPRHYNYNDRRTTPQDDAYDPHPRYPKSRYRTTTASYQPPEPQHMWWRKIPRRQKRQANLSDLCPARSTFIMPRAAQSVEGDWMYLVNVDRRYKQLVKSETCIQNTCEGACDVPQGFSAICQQQYVQKRLVALDGSGSKLNSDTFWFPSCCLCRIRANDG